MSPKTCAITGTTGFVGGRLAASLRSAGLRVLELNRSVRDSSQVSFVLGPSIDPAVFNGVQVLLHCAYDYSLTDWPSIVRVNIEGTRQVFESAKQAGVQTRIQMSSFAAFPGCRSMYGKAKLECERIVHEFGGSSIRAGLIYGDESRGVLAKIEQWVRTLPMIPLLSAESVMYVCHVDDLCRLITEMVITEKAPSSPLYAANPTPHTFKEIVRHLQRVHGRSQPVISTGWRIPWLAIRLLERLGFKPPFRSDSVIGLVDQNRTPDFSPLRQFQTTFRNIS